MQSIANSVVTEVVGGVLRGVNQKTSVEIDCNKTIQRPGFTNSFGQIPQEEIFQFEGSMNQIRIPNFRAIVNLSPELESRSNNLITISIDKPTLAVVSDERVTADRTCRTFETIKDSNSSNTHKGQLLCFVDPKEDRTASKATEVTKESAPDEAMESQSPIESASNARVGGYTCEQQKEWGKCNKPWMSPVCDHVCKTQ